MDNYKTLFFVFLTSIMANVQLLGQNASTSGVVLPETTIEDQLHFQAILEKISERYKIEFAYDHQLLSHAINEGCPENMDLKSCIAFLFINTDIEYQITEEQILLRNKNRHQEGIELSGYITDKDSGESLPYVLIHDEMNNHFYSDSAGFFKQTYKSSEIPDTLQFNYLGYSSTFKIVATGTKKDLNIQMVPKINLIPVIRITSPVSRMGSISISKIDPLQQNSFGSVISGNDVLRTVQLQAGVSASNDLSSEIKIRGSKAFETMIELDGMVLYNPTHFYNFFSAINDDFVDEIELFQNNMPIEYSGRTGGLVKMDSKDLSNSNYGLKTSADLLNAAAILEIPINQNMSIMLAGRTSYTDIIQSDILKTISGNQTSDIGELDNRTDLIQQLDPQFQYYDINAKFQANFDPDHSLDFNFYSSRDQLNNTLLVNTSPFTKVNNFLFDYNDQTKWDNTGLSANYNFKFSSKHKSKLTLSYSKSNFGEDFSFYNYIETNHLERELDFKNVMSNQIGDIHMIWHNKWMINQYYSLSYGLEAGKYETSANIANEKKNILDYRSSEQPIAVFQEIRAYHGNWKFSLGTRFNYLVQNGSFLADPRLALDYKLNDGFGDLYGSFSFNHQFLYQFTYENHFGQSYSFWTLSDSEIPVMNSLNTTIGYKFQNEHFKFFVEAYHKKRNNITEIAILKPGLPDNPNQADSDEFKLFIGQGNILGVDFSLAKKYKKLTTQLNYTLSYNMVQFDQIFNGKPFPAQDDRRHQFKWLNSLDHGNFSLTMNTIFSSGKPFFDVSNLTREKNRKDLKLKDQIKFIPPYFRLDLGINYNKKILGRDTQFGFSVFNVTNRQNLYNVQYIRPVQLNGQNSGFAPVGAQTSMLGRTLNLSVALTF